MAERRATGLYALGVLAAGLAGAASAQAPIPAAGALPEQRRWLLEQVQLGQATGRQALVEDALARLRMLAPNDPATLAVLLEVQLAAQKFDEAAATRQRLRALAPAGPDAAIAERLWNAYRGPQQRDLQQARLLAKGGRHQEALAIYERLFGGKPPGLQLGLEYWQLRGSQPEGREAARRGLAALAQAYPGNIAIQQARKALGDTAAAQAAPVVAAIGTAVGTAGDAAVVAAPEQDPAEQAASRARRLLDAEHPVQAEHAYRQALRGRPRASAWRGGLGLALLRQGRRAAALEQFELALRHRARDDSGARWRELIARTRHEILLEQAGAALTAGDAAGAEALYQQARRQAPRQAAPLLGLAEVALARQDDAAAEAWLLDARGLAPGNAEALRSLVRLYARVDAAKLEALIAGLPQAQRAPHEQALRQARIARLERQVDAARAAVDGGADRAPLIALQQALRRETPGDPWLALRLARDLRAAGDAGAADAVLADMLAHAGKQQEARYAQALYLSGADRPDDALAALAEVPEPEWTPDMRALAGRLRHDQLLARLQSLRAAGRVDEATALLHAQPDGVDKYLLLGEWARERGAPAEAADWYARVLAEAPDNLDARLGQVGSLAAAGQTTAARGALEAIPPIPADSAGTQRRLADIWLALGERARARALLEDAVAGLQGPDAQLRRDLARLTADRDPRGALDMYALAMRDAGLLPASAAAPRDDRALTRATRAVAADDWLARSLRSDVVGLYQRQNPTLTLMQDAARRSDGAPGFSRLARDTRIVHLSLPAFGGNGWARLEQLTMDAGSFPVDASGGHREDFGTCGIALVDAAGAPFAPPACTRDLHQRQVSGAGWAVGWARTDDRFAFDLGRTPAGLVAANWVGGATASGDAGVLGWSATFSRRPMTNSLLSQAGAVDPRSRIRWGGVLAQGITLGLGYDRGGRNGMWSNWGWHDIVGHNVAANSRLRAMGGWYHKLVQAPDLRVDVGVSAMAWRYRRDLGGYALGQGGYYSPQRYVSLGLPLSLAWRNQDWSLRMDGSFGWSHARTDPALRYPLQPLVQQVVDDIAAQAAQPLAMDPATTGSAGGSSSGTGYRLYAALERRLGDHLVLGASANLQRSRDYSPNTFEVYVRHVFRPWQGNLPLPVAPLTPYGEFR